MAVDTGLGFIHPRRITAKDGRALVMSGVEGHQRVIVFQVTRELRIWCNTLGAGMSPVSGTYWEASAVPPPTFSGFLPGSHWG